MSAIEFWKLPFGQAPSILLSAVEKRKKLEYTKQILPVAL
jgi:hypothetical protein